MKTSFHTMTKAATSPDVSQSALSLDGYSLEYATRSGSIRVLDNINLRIAPGQTLGLVGESGSGKSSLAWAIARYLPGNARELGGSIRLGGEELRGIDRRRLGEIRGRRLSMVFQDPGTSLNPTLALGQPLLDVLTRHRRLTPRQAREEATALLARTGIARPAEMLDRYPHQVSGGEKQRVVIATAFACEPECILFDEPTTALDVMTSRRILELFQGLQQETGVAALYISHDLALTSMVAHDIAVIHRGRIIEQGAPARLFARPSNAYTRQLIEAIPDPRHRLVPPLAASDADTYPLLRLNRLGVSYRQSTFLQRVAGRLPAPTGGVSDVSFQVRPGEIIGIVGESGSGKSSLAKALAGLEPFEGHIAFDGHDIARRESIDRRYRRDVQMIFQHPDASLNPRRRIGAIVGRPLRLYGLAKGAERRERVESLLERVGLPRAYTRRYPHQLSGGEKQRVSIARAFASRPRLVICDEMTSALDVTVQAKVARLLVELQQAFGTSCLFITHDLHLVRQLAHRIVVMSRGEMVDLFDVADIDSPERHDYTRQLMAALPPPEVSAETVATHLHSVDMTDLQRENDDTD